MVGADRRWIGDLGPCLGRLVGLLALTRSLDADDRHPLIIPSTTSTMGSQALDGQPVWCRSRLVIPCLWVPAVGRRYPLVML